MTHSRTPTLRALVAVALVGLAAGCATHGRDPVYVTVNGGDPPPVSERSSDAEVLRSVATVLVTRLGLPLTPPVRAYFYGSPEDFEHGLVTHGGVNAEIARDRSTLAVGVGARRAIFLRGDRLRATSFPTRVGVLAHELTHISQYELGDGRRGSSEQWLREGFAECVKFRTLESLGIRSYLESRAATVSALRSAMLAAPLPGLETLEANRDWIAALRSSGGFRTYGQAFLATDRLVERVGHRRVVDYFRRASASRDRDATFMESFGISRAEYFADFRGYLASL